MTSPEQTDWPLAERAVFLTGPTGSGKTAVALCLAERLGAEIVSMDSMALYRGMDLGTAKPTPRQRRRVPHHLIDIIEPWQDYSLAQYLAAAQQAVESIRSRGRLPLFVGGTPLYLMALLRGACTGPPPNRRIRARLHQEAAEFGTGHLHGRLAQLDPLAAQRIHPNDLRRIVRALEVFEQTGQPISAQQRHFHQPPNRQAQVWCLHLPRQELYRRIDTRVRDMFDRGLIQEVRRLLQGPRPLSRTAAQALGYKETIEYLAGARPLAETVELVQRRTRQFAKRQLTWFRRIGECQPVAEADPEAVADHVAKAAGVR